jgi:transcriptional regulator with XRE-family HTH domain
MIGKKIASLRKEKKLSVEELSLKLNIESDVINKWEKGDLNPEISDLIKLSEFFDISTDFLLEQTNTRNFTYYEREVKPEKKLELYHVIAIIFLTLSSLTIITFIIVSIFEPRIYFDLATNTNYEGIAAYWKAYIEVRVGLIISLITFFISLIVLLLPLKVIKYFTNN